MNAAFFASVRASLFAGSLSQPQVDGMNAIGAAWAQFGDSDRRKLAYLLATTLHETARTMQPIREYGQRSYFDKYEPGTKIGKALGNTLKGDGYRFRGAGFVQLTGRANYARAGAALGVDLVANPELALEPVVAARILVRGCMAGWFTGRKLGDYIGATGCDYAGARRVVNGTDRATEIAGYAVAFARALALPGAAHDASNSGALPPKSPSASAAPKGIWPTLWAAILKIIDALKGHHK